MTVLTQDKKIERTDGVELPFPVKEAANIFAGALVATDATGYLVRGSDTAALVFQGFAIEHRDNSDGQSGDIVCTVRRRGLIKCGIAAAGQDDVGKNVFLVDDQTVGLAATTTHDIFCGTIAGYVNSTTVWVDIEPAVRKAPVEAHIAEASSAHGASAISIADAGEFTSAEDVEAALQELYPKAPVGLTDPGDAGAIPVGRSGSVAITTTEGGGETRTLAIPGKKGITLTISFDVDGGDCVITAAAAINVTGNNTITLDTAGQTIVLVAVQVAGGLVWRVLANDGCSLSTE